MEQERLEWLERRILHPLESLKVYQDQISQELNQLAASHVERSNGLLTLLPIGADEYPAQRITRAFLNGKETPLDKIQEYATGAEPQFSVLLDKLDQTNEIERLGEDLESGQNIMLVTNHGEVKDIAIALAAFHNRLKSKGYEFNTGLMISKMIAHLGFYGEPAVDVLRVVCDRQYFSFPRTESIKSSRIPERVVKAHNGVVRQIINHHIKDGGYLFAMAPSGTTDKAMDPSRPDEISLAPVGSATAKILTHKNTKVMPVAVWLDEECPAFEMCDIPRAMKDDDDNADVHSMMNNLARTLTEKVIGKNFVYSGSALGQIALQAESSE